MIETLSILPASFWVVAMILVGGGVWSFFRLNEAIGLPMLAVLGTVAAWYVGDAFYNDYANYHAKIFPEEILQSAWWQVAWFLVVFLLATPPIHRWMNARYLHQRSGVMQLFSHGVDFPVIQRQLKILFTGAAAIWVILFVFAALILRQEILYYLFPFLGYRANPWAHGRIGSGIDAFSVLAVYLQLLAAILFGVVAALVTDRQTRFKAIIFLLLAWPFFIFDRTRNTMLAMVVPAVLGWVFLRMRGGLWKKALVLLFCFLLVNTWMKFVIANRSHMSITAALKAKGLNLKSEEKVHNEGLNMFEELCWINRFIENGSYRINWGKRYFAELVNPIPRGLWPGKPLIGIDYAIARGQGGADASSAGVYATISTGLIGQGVTNFGRFLGPMAAALLTSLWAAWLARLDLTVSALGRLPLYSLGLILTFVMGRDISLIALYPFLFGYAISYWLESRNASLAPAPKPAVPHPAKEKGGKTSQNLPRQKGQFRFPMALNKSRLTTRRRHSRPANR